MSDLIQQKRFGRTVKENVSTQSTTESMKKNKLKC